jgi:hypothetical protein
MVVIGTSATDPLVTRTGEGSPDPRTEPSAISRRRNGDLRLAAGDAAEA